MQEVAELNGIEDVTKIHVGQRIFIPGATRPIKVIPYKPIQPPEEVHREPRIKTFRGRFIWPVKGRITSSFGVRNGIKHSGIDISAPTGFPVRAAATGEVVFVGRIRGYGKVIIVKHSKRYSTVYSHLKDWTVKKGQKVQQGMIIGHVGDTGRSSGPHLHFEVRVESRARNPLFYLPK
jgi:murein DD-endopeptidase MepM/ murein hydrolase activator NlpD